MSYNFKAGIAFGFKMSNEEFNKNIYKTHHSTEDWESLIEEYIIFTNDISGEGDVIFGINMKTVSFENAVELRKEDLTPAYSLINVINSVFREYFPKLAVKPAKNILYLKIC